MKKKHVVLIIVGFLALVTTITWISASNTEIENREAVVAQQDVCKANFDKMFKSIQQVAGVAEHNMKQSKEAFKEIYPQLMEGRYSDARGGALMSWVGEHNPNFDLNATSSLYGKLQTVIESNREAYFLEQKKLISFHQEHSKHIKKFPANMFVGGRGEVDIIVITSTETKNVYSKGIEDDLTIFED